ncbi:hypothetical protein EDC58_0439 [Caminibacter pacificus]|jgi:hypothetical protein|uniref:Lipoprotein n=1 Tax=Caminibacter pacificus TaxID=1424653 RepID=A0AAJ4UYK2_9BACT|nr:hypothetical protein EDC58_0439 [Caminibacter pacificus]
MAKYLFCCFHIVIIATFLGCGYKAPPTWNKSKQKVQEKDLQIIDLNSTLKVKIGVK